MASEGGCGVGVGREASEDPGTASQPAGTEAERSGVTLSRTERT